jgi:hypothetical protein
MSMGNPPTIRASEVPESVETYRFMYVGGIFAVMVIPDESATTTAPPNLHVLEGSWKTWRVEVDPDVSGLAGVRVLRSVGADGGEHPLGNQPSGPSAYSQLMITSDGFFYEIPTGWGLAARFYSPDEWAFLIAGWEEEVHAEGRHAAEAKAGRPPTATS